jgi:hypothetical protein
MKTHLTTLKGFWAYVAALVTICSLMSEGRGLAQDTATLQPPPGNVEIVRAYGVGVQIYHSAPSATDPTKFVWKFFAPEATLFNNAGNAFIHHFGGPSWETDNGSLVVGALVDAEPSANPNSIAQLLLSGASHSGNGLLSRVTFIQRLDTSGGVAPATLPTALGQEVQVPYTATYVFFNSSHGDSSSRAAAHR